MYYSVEHIRILHEERVAEALKYAPPRSSGTNRRFSLRGILRNPFKTERPLEPRRANV